MLITNTDARQPVAEGLLRAEAVHRDVGHGPVQPVAPLLLGQAPQPRPGPGRGLEGGLDEVMGQRLVTPGHHAGMPEQVAGMDPEAHFQLLGILR